ncbi:hypothetical protein NB231_08385 [Nitrococcus mobilis Nb-231]|uniref:ATP-grasp domain-containing protein n=1 Tax=Nitrococcus mobilis Nb-231 TaxID=314278 RepID=A4BSJ0_9GAMM|nr:hypothetical protein NB231_08385 [Nitrococcus mobilis Nb-231]
MLGIDTQIGLTVIRELCKHGVTVHGIASDATGVGLYSRYLATGHIRSETEDGIIQQINTLARQTGTTWLLAVGESDILLINRRRDELIGITPLIPEADEFAKVLDKQTTLAAARSVGIITPQSWALDNLNDFEKIKPQLRFPVVIKWRNPHRVVRRLGKSGKTLQKYRYAYDPDELIEYLGKFEIIGELPLIQEYCPGYGVGQMLFLHEGKTVLRFQHRRIAEWPPEGGASAVCESLPIEAHNEMMAKSEALLRLLGWSGPAMVEYRYDPETQKAMLMEVNGRFWGSLPLAHHAGAHFVWLTLAIAAFGQVPEMRPYTPAVRCRSIVPELKRLLRVTFHPEMIQDKMLRPSWPHEWLLFLVRYLVPRTYYYVFSFDDPRPFIMDSWLSVRRVVTRRFAGGARYFG